MKKRNRGSFFTLLELCVVLSIVALISTFSFFSFQRALPLYHFEKNSAQVQDLFSFAHHLALVRQCDLVLRFSQSTKGMRCDLGIEEGKDCFRPLMKPLFLKGFSFRYGRENKKNLLIHCYSSNQSLSQEDFVVFLKAREDTSRKIEYVSYSQGFFDEERVPIRPEIEKLSKT